MLLQLPLRLGDSEAPAAEVVGAGLDTLEPPREDARELVGVAEDCRKPVAFVITTGAG